MIKSLSNISVNQSVAIKSDYSAAELSPNKDIATRAFLELIVDNNRDIPTPIRPLSLYQHRMARRRVFENIVSSTLNNPQHPFSGLSTAMKQDMIEAITAELVESHFLS